MLLQHTDETSFNTYQDVNWWEAHYALFIQQAEERLEALLVRRLHL